MPNIVDGPSSRCIENGPSSRCIEEGGGAGEEKGEGGRFHVQSMRALKISSEPRSTGELFVDLEIDSLIFLVPRCVSGHLTFSDLHTAAVTEWRITRFPFQIRGRPGPVH